LFVTTAGRTNAEMIHAAIKIATQLKVPYIQRNKRSILDMQSEQFCGCLVVGKERLELFDKGEPNPFFFHPNSAMFRIKRIMNGDQDPFVEAAQLKKGMSLLDCTLGLASDSIVASFVVGDVGKVTGVEGQKYISYVVGRGLKTWDSDIYEINDAMRRVRVVTENSLIYLKSLPTECYDCVYFDPMFEEKILESDGIKALDLFALHDTLNDQLMNEAIRVAKHRILLKDHYLSTRFQKFGFQPFRRKTSKFHFGVIEKT
jgi:hypothetical protein